MQIQSAKTTPASDHDICCAGDSSYVASTGFAVKYNYSWGKGST